jgi:3-methyladenine DNA glycosylase AlkD
MWKRRAAIIAQVRRKAATDFVLLTECIEPNRGDREFFIRNHRHRVLRVTRAERGSLRNPR